MPVVTRSQTRAKDDLFGVINLVADFLKPRDLLRFSYVTKDAIGALSMEDIVRTIAINGNLNQRTGLELLYELTSVGSIYPPSPRRVLQLANVIYCEECCRYFVRHVRKGWGLATCYQCQLEGTKEIFPLNAQKRSSSPVLATPHCGRMIYYSDIIRMPRVASTMRMNVQHPAGRPAEPSYFLLGHKLYRHRHEDVGPIVTAGDVRRFTKMRSLAEVDQYMKENLRAPPMDAYEEFNASIMSMRSFSAPHVLVRTAKKKIVSKATKWIARQKKIANVKVLLRRIASHRGLATSIRPVLRRYRVFRIPYDKKRRGDALIKKHCIKFLNDAVQETLQSYILSPTKARGAAALSLVVDVLNAQRDRIRLEERRRRALLR